MERTTAKGKARTAGIGFPRRPLAAAFALALGASGIATDANAALVRTRDAAHASRTPAHPATTYEVTRCADDGSPGTLRYVIEHAVDGDAADLSTLACSTISLENGEILLPMNNFSIIASTPVTIDAHRASRTIEHDGTGVLYLVNVDVANGYFKYNSTLAIAKGGCILSDGFVKLAGSSVSGCQAVDIEGQVRGGGIYSLGGIGAYNHSVVSNNIAGGISAIGGGAYSFGSVYFADSTIDGNTANAVTGTTGNVIEGGGLFTSGVARLVNTTISGNVTRSNDGASAGGGVQASSGVYLAFSQVTGNSASGPSSSGGGVSAQRNSYVYYSTIDHNESSNNAGLAFAGTPGTVRIGNSTISSNLATNGSSALFSSMPTLINNSTIAFNAAQGNDAGLYFYVGATPDIESTIIANNVSASGTSFDIASRDPISGAHNLIRSPGAAVPGDTLVGIDPELLPLATNFSVKIPPTHALASTSPAIDRGSNLRNFDFDERGPFHARTFGIAPDIGAYEYDGIDDDTIFADGFE
jgi:hypothetical protein